MGGALFPNPEWICAFLMYLDFVTGKSFRAVRVHPHKALFPLLYLGVLIDPRR
jgi:hypothetical protein